MADSPTADSPAELTADPPSSRPVDQALPTAVSTEDLAARLDVMNAQIAAMAEELREARQAREQWQELLATLVPVSRGAMDVATRELQDLSADVSMEDASRLARTAIRSMPQLESLLIQLDSAADLGHELTSITGAGVEKLTEVLQTAEDRGYFAMARQGALIADRIVTSFTEEEVAELGNNIVSILTAVKEMTQPEIMALVRRTMVTVQEDEGTHLEPPTFMGLVRSIRDPQTRRGLARVMAMLHTVGTEERVPSLTKGNSSGQVGSGRADAR